MFTGLSTFIQKDKVTATDLAHSIFHDLKCISHSDHFAQCILGWFYHDGIGCDVDLLRAIDLYQASAEAGNDVALNNLGYCYSAGEGVDK